MEAWENILGHFQSVSDSKECLRILKVAEFTLDKDLAPFEQDYVFKTLFKEPISLIKLLKEKNSDPSWSKVISDWLKLLANVVTKYKLDNVYLKMLSELCTLPYDAHTNQQALNCLTSIVKHSNYGVDNITKHLYALELGTSCKAQLAVLVGTICKHHPERVADNINTIWRVFLNLFDIGKYSTPVIKAVLQSIENMLEHFGTELPMIELNIFYEKLIQCFDIERCADVCVSILGKYASLFRERLHDPKVHAQLWARIDNPTARDTLKAVYKKMEIKKPEETIKQVKFYASSDNMQQKLTALTLLQTLQNRELHKGLEVGEYLDLAVLEFRMRNGTLTHDCCDAISWCIESHVYHSDRLARVALVTYDVIPVGRRRQVIQSVLKCAPHMSQEIIEFLLFETCNNPEKFKPVWDDILDKDATELRNNYLVQEFIVGIVKAIGVMLEKIENWTDPPPEHISLLRLTWSVLRAEPRERDRSLGRMLRRCAREHCEAVPAALIASYDKRDQIDISVDRFTSDAALINCWMSLMQVWDIRTFATHDILKHLQITFSHKSVDAATLRRTIDILQDFIHREKDNELILDENILDGIYRRIHKIANNKVEDKEGRILRKRAIEFLAKYRRVTADGISPDVVLMTSLKESLFINVPENNAHTKMDLNKILYKALVDENENALRVLMGVICQSLSIRKESLLQSALYRVLSALSRFSMNWDTLKYYMSHCEPNSAFELVKYILQEKFPDSREKLLHGLEILLSGDVEEDVFGELLEQVLLSETLNNIEADVLMVILRAITDNNILIQKYITQMICKAINCNDLTKMATEIFVNRIGLFEKEAIEKLIVDLFKMLHNFKFNENNNAVTVLTFINVLMKQIDCDQFKIISCFIEMDPPNLHMLSCMRREFNMTEEDCEIVYTQNKDRITKRLFEDDILDDINDKLEFLTEFSETSLLNDDAIDFIVKVIDNVSQNSTVDIHDNLEKRLKRIKSNLTSISLETISNSINGWVKQHLSILEDIGKRYLKNNERKTISIMKVFCEVFEVESVLERKQILIDTLLYIINERDTLNFYMVEQNLEHHVDSIDIMMKVVDDDQMKAILKGDESDWTRRNIGIQFCKKFISSTYKHLTRKPYVLLDPQLKDAATLLIHIVKESLNNGDLENILEIVDELWPTYLGVSTFEDRHFILLHMSRSAVRLSPESKPMQWLLQTLDSPDTKTRERIMLIDVIPEGEEYNSAYLSIASRLPTRLDEIKGTLSSYFRGILESFATTRNTKLLEIIMNFASSADDRGWWDDAMTVTVYALSVHEDMSLCEDVYRRSECALGGVTRLLVPLLRFSKASFCEEFFSSYLPLLLPVLEKKPRAASMHYTYQKYVQDTIRAFTVLEVLFQKVPRQSIESPKSRLYHKITDKVGDSPFWIVKTACKLGLTLKAGVKCPDDADDKMKNSYRLFHCAIYNCVVSALCCRDPNIDVYATVFDKKTWPELISTDHLSLPIRYRWNRNSAHYTASQRTRTSGTLTRTLTRTQSRTHTRTELTRDFTHTLSENPLQYDLHETEVQAQEVPVGDNALNRHECSAALMMILRKVAPHDPNKPMQLIAAALKDELHCNAKWLLAQAICNCKEELKSHASVLRPALLDVASNTTTNMFNSVHFDILETIISWHNEEELPSSCIGNLNSTIKHLITTTLEYRSFAVVRSLLEKLEKLLDMYPNVVTISGQFFEDKIVDFQSEMTKRCIQILKRITKAKIEIPELLPTVIQAIEGKRVSPDVTELFGLALAISPNTEVQKKFRSMLEKTRRSDVAEYIKLLYYTQKGYPKCCDEANFRVVSDLLPKIVGREKVKCVQIIVKCISEGIGNVDNLPLQEVLAEETGLELLTHSLPQVSENDRRQLVLQVANLCDNPKQKENVFKVILKAFQLLISEPSEPASKRLAESSKICSLVRSADDYAVAILPLVGKAVMSETEDVRVVQEYLSTDSNVRFCECIAIAVYFPLIYGGSTNMQRALGTALLLYFNQDRQQTKQSTVNDKNSRYNIKFSSSLSTLNVRDVETQVSNTQIRKPMSPEEVLDELLKYALEDPSVAVTICTQLIQAHRGTKRPGFDFDDTLYDMFSRMLQHVCDVTPHIMEMMMTLRHWEPSLKRTVDKLSKLTIDSEAQDLCKLFKEDFQIHTLGPEHLVRGFPYDGDVAMLQVDNDISRFSIDDLVSTFDKLSDWDNIPIQEKNDVRANLPPLWTSVDKIKEQLQLFDGCVDGPTWFDKMVDVYKGGDVDHMCFRRYDQWPRKMFELSSMVELLDWEILRMQKREWERNPKLPVFVHPTECVAKHAARLLIRQAFFTEMKTERHISEHLMALCEVTNRSGLFHVTQSCIKFAQESSKKMKLKFEALRGLAEQTNNRQILEEAYIEPENLTRMFKNWENPDAILKAHNIALLVSRDVKRLSKDGVEAAISQCLDITTNKENITSESISDLSSITTVAVTYFDSIWDETDPAERDGLLKTMCDSLNVYLNMNFGDKWKLMLDMIICRLDYFKTTPMSEETAVCLLNQIKLVPNLDEFSKDQILSNIDAFPSHLREGLSELQGDSEMMMKLKKCFQLVADVEHLLKDYCRWLGDALRNNDKALWCQTFNNMKEKIFENPYAGADYQVLFRYKKTLYDMEEFDPQSEENKTKLSAIERELRSDRSVLQLPQLCPELCAAPERPSVAALLGLRKGLTVVKFDKKVTIFPGAVRRPALLTARTHDGGVRRVIIKSGERAAAHAAAVRTLASITSLYPAVNVQTNYTVTALSEDCALIEYLEDRVRLRDLIKSVHPIDDILRNVQRAKNSELILSPQTALNTYNKICSQISPMILRWAIQATSISVEDFIIRKKNFLESVSIMTIGTFILGVGDRHLENILWSGGGGACGVDWAALLQYGRAELPPARLSRSVLAAADVTALESRLQKLLSILRDNCQLLLPSIRVGFKWMGEEFEEKYSYMENLIRGTALSYHVTQQVIQRSDRPYADKYVQLLDEVFADFPQREMYGVVEQVSSILRQSTDPRILSVVRSEWEPWI